MSAKEQTKGTCKFCGKEMTRGGLAKHFYACKAYNEAINMNKPSQKAETIYHLVVYNSYKKEYWLHLEMSGKATLEDLDDYLRAIWLECCGHMSQFSLGSRSDEIPKHTKVDIVFSSTAKLIHEYDFGDTTESVIGLLGQRKGIPLSQYPIYLMARNQAPHFSCSVCHKDATSICLDCLYEDGESGLLCDKHADEHEHEEYGMLPLLNSPRSGACAYDGPAEPPY